MANPSRLAHHRGQHPAPARDTRSAAFTWLLDHLHDIVTSAQFPDVAVTATTAAVTRDMVQPLPAVQTADVLGLLEYLDTQLVPVASSRLRTTPTAPSWRY